jgi:Family of unknown function (DUF5995)
MRRRRVRGLIMVLAAAFTLGVAASPAAADALPVPWPLRGSLEPVPQPPDPTVPFLNGVETICPDGTRACYEQLQHDLLVEENNLGCNRAGVFNDAYVTITQKALDAAAKGFFDPKTDRLYHEGTQYGRQYLSQLNAWRNGELNKVVPAWAEAFRAADKKTNTGIGDLLMQLAAHILYDNPVRAIEQSESVLRGPGPMPGSSGRDTHDRVNDVLQDSLVIMMAHLAAVYDPSIDDGVELFGRVMDPEGMYVTIWGWRERAWRAAEQLRHARAVGGVNGPAYQGLLQTISDDAKNVVLAIKKATRETSQQTAAREAYCAAHFVPVDPNSRPYWVPPA